ncbi:MAG: CPBP family intramembrane metalloprotease, partial [Clostridia bacterium]|nr:CPBP family intramembrane metalloprotease [Clostridia bacterium]
PKTEWRQAPSVPRLPFLFLPMAIGAGYLCSDLFSRIFGSVLERFSQSAGAESYYRHPAAVALYFVNICILAPLLEEFLYRGILLKHLLPLGEPTAVLVSALVFGFAHISLSQTIFAFAVGIALGIARTRSGSIWFGVLIHFTANLFSFGVSYWGFVFEEPWATPVTNAIYMLLIGAAIAGSVVYFVRSIVMIASARRRGEVRTPEENKTSGWKWFFGNPLLYVFAAFYIALLFIYYRA